jgi:hypothetical protein
MAVSSAMRGNIGAPASLSSGSNTEYADGAAMSNDSARDLDRAWDLWESPSSVISYVRMTAAVVTGSRPDLGDHRKVVL